MDPVTLITTTLSSITSVIDIAKMISSADQSLLKAELKGQIADLMMKLADTKILITQINDVIGEKDEQIRNLQHQLAIRKNIKYKKPYYIIINEKEEEDGPFCQKCYDNDSKVIRLQETSAGNWQCMQCHCFYKDSNYKPITITNKYNPLD